MECMTTFDKITHTHVNSAVIKSVKTISFKAGTTEDDQQQNMDLLREMTVKIVLIQCEG